jgi:hypothetical protein
MGKLGVYRYADNFHLALRKFIQPVIERDQLGGTHEGEVQRIEEHHGIFTGDMFFQIKRLIEIVVAHHGNCGEIGCGFADEYSHVHLLIVGYVGSCNLDACQHRVNLQMVVGFEFAGLPATRLLIQFLILRFENDASSDRAEPVNLLFAW